MESNIYSQHFDDENGNPAGGITYGHGFTIAWQNGPLLEAKGGRNGAFVEDIILAAIDRFEYYQSGRFSCEENEEALMHLSLALNAMRKRLARRNKAGIEGTHQED